MLWPGMESSIDLKLSVPADDHQLDLYTIPTHSSWFAWKDIHENERIHLREYFDGSSMTRTPKIYKEYRDFIISKYREDPSRRLSFTEVRKSLVGDVSLLYKVFSFLEKWGLINFGAPASGEVAVEEEGHGKCKVKVEEGAPAGVRVVAVPNSLKPVTLPQSGSDGIGEVAENGFKFPALASYTDVYSEVKGKLCENCKERCDTEYYECKKEGSYIICTKCYKNGNYGANKSVDDFKLIESITDSSLKDGAVWTEAETLLLLESVLKHGDDWELVAQNVKTKNKQECISKLIQLPFGELMLGSAHKKGSCWDTDGNMIAAKQGQLASAEFHSQEKIETEGQDNELEHKSEQNGYAENKAPVLKRKRSVSPSDTSGSLMKQVALISSVVGPRIAASAASAAVTALCYESQCPKEIFDGDGNEDQGLGTSPQNNKERGHQDDGLEVGERPSESETQSYPQKDMIPLTLRMRAATATALGAAAAHAKLLADQEEREIEYLVATIIEAQLKKLRQKVKHFEDLEQIMEKEYTQVEELKKALTSERLSVLRGQLNAGISRWKDHASVKSLTGGV